MLLADCVDTNVFPKSEEVREIVSVTVLVPSSLTVYLAIVAPPVIKTLVSITTPPAVFSDLALIVETTIGSVEPPGRFVRFDPSP